MYYIARILMLVIGCLQIVGCASSVTPKATMPDPLGPFSRAYWRNAERVESALLRGSVDEFHALHANIQGMAGWSLWSLYPRGSGFAAASDGIFTDYISMIFESDVRHWLRVIEYGTPDDRATALAMMKLRASNLIRGYPFSIEGNRREQLGFAVIAGMMSEHILDDIAELVAENIDRWPPDRQAVGLCVLAHAGNKDALSIVAQAFSQYQEGVRLDEDAERALITMMAYRSSAKLERTWPNQPSERTR